MVKVERIKKIQELQQKVNQKDQKEKTTQKERERIKQKERVNHVSFSLWKMGVDLDRRADHITEHWSQKKGNATYVDHQSIRRKSAIDLNEIHQRHTQKVKRQGKENQKDIRVIQMEMEKEDHPSNRFPQKKNSHKKQLKGN